LGSHLEAAVEQMGVPLYFLEVVEKRLHWVHDPKLDALFKKYRPTIVHTHLGGIIYAFVLAMKYRTPVRVHTLHNIAPLEMGTGPSRRVRLLAFRYRIGSFVPVAIAKEVARTFETLYGYRNPPLIPNGIPVHDFTPNPTVRASVRQSLQCEPSSVIFIHIGRFFYQKNHELLINAFAHIQLRVPVELWLVGDGELRETVQHQVSAMGVENRVRFLGVRSDIPDLLRAADVFVFPSRWEGNPLSVMEAMAAGLPVVATAVGGVPELVEDGVSGILVPNEDLEGLTTAMQRMAQNPDLREQMGRAARCRAVERFDIRQTVRAYEALYEEILQRKRRR
jgi:glycosyltransferase involved in cell wall biosynthesis